MPTGKYLGLAVFSLFACSNPRAAPTGTDAVDATLQERTSAPDGDGSLHSGSDSSSDAHAEGERLLDCGKRRSVQVFTPQYEFGLERLCELLGEQGVACPADRNALVETLGAQCGDGVFPVLKRYCGVDEVEGPASGSLSPRWVFDSESGELRGVTVQSFDGPCGEGTYRAGAEPAACGTDVTLCELCLGGPQRDATCPAEVVEVLPNRACPAPAVESSCEPQCDGLLEGDRWFDADGTPCELPSACRCQSGTCWAECLCMHDGVSRWRIGCTE